MNLHEPTGIAYRTRNAGGAGVALVFIHGAAGNKLAWLTLTRRLAALMPENPIYFLDLPGHGESQGTGYDSVERYAADLKAFVDDVAHSRAFLIGHSMGGAVALTAALDYPGIVEKIAVMGSGYRIPVNPALFAAIEADYSAAMEMMRQWGFGDHIDPHIADAVIADMKSCDPQVAFADFKACEAYNIKERIGGLRAPLAVLYGNRDVMTSENRNKGLAAAVRGAKIICFEGAGHMLMAERPDEAADALAEFFND